MLEQGEQRLEVARQARADRMAEQARQRRPRKRPDRLKWNGQQQEAEQKQLAVR